MKTDPIVEEVRAARRQVEMDAAASGLALGDYLRQKQKSASRLVRRGPQPLCKRKTA